MKTYKVVATIYTTLVCEIEAEDLDQAWKIAQELDGSSFKELPDPDWDIANVYEVKGD